MDERLEPNSELAEQDLEQLAASYRLTDVIASGSKSVVFKAVENSTGRLLAIKVVRPWGTMSWSTSDSRYYKEVLTGERLQHPNLVPVQDSGKLPTGAFFLAMDYVDGTPLSALIQQGPVPLGLTLTVVHQCSDALQYAHNLGVVHRDMKPDNILLTGLPDQCQARIVDFGVAKLLDKPGITFACSMVGTPNYMSPEQCRGETATPHSDQYALGLVLYEMLTGVPAIDGDSPLSFLHLHQSFTPPPPSRVVDSPQVALADEVTMRMIAKEPEERYADMGRVVLALDRIIEQLG